MQRFGLVFNPLRMACTLVFLMLGNAQAASENSFKDPLDTPATKIGGVLKLEQQPILALATVKGRVIGVGLRGLIVVSDNGGLTWRQVPVPVQSDLTAVTFPTDRHGWAVGHDGIILTTGDAGETWTKQFDGKMATTVLPEYYQKRVEAGDASMQSYLEQTRRNVKIPAALPYLSVYFENEHTGYVVGSFGMILITQDGGKTWEPWLHHVDNDRFFNLNDIRQIGSTLYMVGERGIIWKLDKTKQRFNSVTTGYRGSFFAIAGNGDRLLAVGLGGTAFRSADGGATATWQSVNIGTHALTAITNTHDGLLPLIASQNGELFIGDADWQTFRSLPVDQPIQLTSSVIAVGDDRIIMAGYDGIRVQVVKPVPATIKEK